MASADRIDHPCGCNHRYACPSTPALTSHLYHKYNMKMLSHVAVYNDVLVVTDPTEDLKKFVEKELTYVDKSKQYQLRRMGRNIWQRNSPVYAQLQREVKGQLYQVVGDKLTVSSSFYELLKDKFNTPMVTDFRCAGGTKVVLPWVNRPYDLRDYQEEAVDLMMHHYRGLINLATGLGKTLIATHFIQRYKRKALVVCPSESVAKQFYKQFVECFGKNKVGFYGSRCGHPRRNPSHTRDYVLRYRPGTCEDRKDIWTYSY